MRIASSQVGAAPRLRKIGSGVGKTLGLVWPLAREGAEMIYQFEQPFVVDGSDFTATFGSSPTSYDQAIASTIAWYRDADSRSTR
jgi:nucleoside-diphosphate-sugar epimerase